MDHDRRDLPRWHLSEEATLILDSDYDVRCPLRDISGSGAAVTTDLKPEAGDEAIIYVRSLGRFRAKVARVGDDHVAFRFLIEDERQIILLERLERRLLQQEQEGGQAKGADLEPLAH
ncbi:PilZ domain-containing protein [uncultured Rhodospira sp.]|uniref:PilZ domain-containing protein n=1 Tax=uncultured Rhodospira sp. TaxID=1936189 RepID=UPI002630225D|nr:PilZ domain-containing protein [uncultured Rhodospira sp.]